jgi:hypothetical protein
MPIAMHRRDAGRGREGRSRRPDVDSRRPALRRGVLAVAFVLVGLAGVGRGRAGPPPTTSAPGSVASTVVVLDTRAPLPGGATAAGAEIAAALTWRDALGDNLLVVSLSKVGSRANAVGETVSDRRLYGQHFTRPPAGPTAGSSSSSVAAWRELWRTQDFVVDCEFDLTAALVPGAVAVTDLDADGTAETRFAYLLGCRSDVSPLDLKLLMHEGAAKYALRGSNRVQHGVDAQGRPEYAGGGFAADPAFAKAPAAFLDDAKATWARIRDASP